VTLGPEDASALAQAGGDRREQPPHGRGGAAAGTATHVRLGIGVLTDTVRSQALLPAVLVDKSGRPFRARLFTRGDQYALEEMYRAFDPKRGAQGLPPADGESIRRWLDHVLAAGTHVLVEVDGEILGHLMVIPMNDETSELANFLHQKIRNRGIGTALNLLALEIAREQGRRRVWLSVEPSNRIAIRSYEKAGFRRLPGSLWAPEVEMEVRLSGNTPG
jgi:RimJ/RimL family protein N-acetyltransferase